MSITGRSSGDAPAASDIAGRLREAEFVRLVTDATGDALAATGLLARALRAASLPFQATIARPWADPTRATDADLTVAIGTSRATAELTISGASAPTSATAFDVAEALGADPDPMLAFAGVRAAATGGGDAVRQAAEAAGVTRRPGVAVPTSDPAEGLAHSLRVHAGFSGDEDAAREALEAIDFPADPDESDYRRVASLVALEATGDEASERAAEAVEAVLRPYVGGPFETIGGYADVIEAVARERPGTAVALALGSDVRTQALSAWRTHARRAHAGIRAATTGRYDGLFVVRDDGDLPVETAARLVGDFRSPEPVTLVMTDDRAAAVRTAAADVDLRRTMTEALDNPDAVCGTARRAVCRVDRDSAEFIMAVREAMTR
jgi:hypothetical protein